MRHSPDHDERRHDHRELTDRRGVTLRFLAVAGIACAATGGVSAQVAQPAGRAAPEIEAARDAQRDFERERRRHYVRDAWGSNRCHEHVGRFCLTHDGDDGWTLPPEAEVVTARRLDLIAVLDSALAASPADAWAAGQRVRYLLEAGESRAALAAAESCRSDPAWCDALLGFVHHEAQRWEDAGEAFASAMAGLPTGERCEWEDISYLIEGGDRDAYGDTACPSAERARLEDRFWHLSEPLWSLPGEGRRSEHYARQVWDRLNRDAASGYGLSWGRDLRELTVRYGWPAGWDLAWRRVPGVRTESSVEAHRGADAQRFAALDVESGEPSWDLDDDRPRSTWVLPVGPVRSVEAYQIASFRRGDRTRVVGAAALPSRPRAPGCDLRTSLILASGDALTAIASISGSGALQVTGPTDEVELVGLETSCRDARDGSDDVRRVRIPVDRPANWLSDLLLLDSIGDLPGTLDATFPHVRPHGIVRPNERIVVFWEWYGPADPMTVTLTLSRRNKSFWRKALEWTGLADRGIERTGVRWSEVGDGGEMPRAMRLDLPDLAPGEYRITLEVQSARVGSVSSTREIVVER